MIDTMVRAIADFLLARYADEELRAQAVYPPGRWWTTQVDELDGDVAVMAPPPPREQRQLDQGAPDDDVWVNIDGSEDVTRHLAEWCPERVLAECEAKRRVVEQCAEYERDSALNPPEALTLSADILRALVQPYANHPAFNDEWRTP